MCPRSFALALAATARRAWLLLPKVLSRHSRDGVLDCGAQGFLFNG
jgi:hypothetical protein